MEAIAVDGGRIVQAGLVRVERDLDGRARSDVVISATVMRVVAID